MSSEALQAAIKRARERTNERDRGSAPALGLRLTSARAADQGIVSIARTPATFNGVPLQDGSGNSLYLDGYSDPSGPDVGAPGP